MSENNEKRTIGVVTQSSTGGATVAGGITIIIVWLLSLSGVEVPPEVASGFTVIIGAIGALVGGWLVKPGDGKRRADG